MDLEQIKKELSAGGEHIGDMLFWALADARVDRAALEATWLGAGLDACFLPEAPTAERALKLAVRESQVGQRDRLLRLGKETEEELVFAVVREHHKDDGSLWYEQEARVSLERASEKISADDSTHDLVVAIESRFRLLRDTHTADDVRRSIVRALHSFAAVSLREGGGIYWTPYTYASQVRQLQRAIEGIGQSRFYLLPVHRSAEAEQTLGDVAKASIEEELAALVAEIDGFLVAPPERPSTLVRRLGTFEELRARGQLYQSVLRTQIQGLDAQLDRLAGVVDGLLLQKSAA